jgi:hypothetical protein
MAVVEKVLLLAVPACRGEASIGSKVINPIRNYTGKLVQKHPYTRTGRGLPTANYGGVGGIVGTSVGTAATIK